MRIFKLIFGGNKKEKEAKVMFNKTLIIILTLMVTATILVYAKVLSAQSVVTDGLISYWTFDGDDINGKIVKDAWGDNDGVIMGNPEISDGRIGQALSFDGDGDYIEVKLFNRSKDNQGTIGAWLKLDDVDGDYSIFQYFVDANNRCKLIYDLKHTKRLRFNLKKTAEWVIIIDGDDEPSANTWYHLTIVQDGTTSTLYINGVAQKTTGSGEWLDDLGNGTAHLGASTTGAKFDYFKGIIDEVSVYNRALSQNEVNRNFASQGLAVVNLPHRLTLTWGVIKSAPFYQMALDEGE